MNINQLFRLLGFSTMLLCGANANAAGHNQDLLLTGFLEVGLGFAHQDCTESGVCSADDDDYAIFQGDARVNIPVYNQFSVQLDLGTTQTDADAEAGSPRQLDNYIHTGAHISYRDPEHYAAGILGQIGLSDGEGGTGGGEDHRANFYLVGVEGQIYFGDFTLYGQTGYFEADDGDNSDVMTDAFYFRGEGRYFLDDNTMVSAELSYVQGEHNDSSDPEGVDGWSWEARFQRAVQADTRLSWYVAYHGTHIEDSEGQLDEHTGLVGLRFQLGGNGPSLKDNDRRGATFSMPDVGRWTAWTMDVVD